MSMITVPGGMVQMGFQQLTGLGTVKSLTVPENARLALIQASAQNVSWRSDGTNPAVGIGMRLAAGSAPFLYQADPRSLRFIEDAVGATVEVTYFG